MFSIRKLSSERWAIESPDGNMLPWKRTTSRYNDATREWEDIEFRKPRRVPPPARAGERTGPGAAERA